MSTNNLIELQLLLDIVLKNKKDGLDIPTRLNEFKIPIFEKVEDIEYQNQIEQSIINKILSLCEEALNVAIIELSLFDPNDKTGMKYFTLVATSEKHILQYYERQVTENLELDKPIIPNENLYDVSVYPFSKSDIEAKCHLDRESLEEVWMNDPIKNKYNYRIGGYFAKNSEHNRPDENVSDFFLRIRDAFTPDKSDLGNLPVDFHVLIPIIKPSGSYSAHINLNEYNDKKHYRGGGLFIIGNVKKGKEKELQKLMLTLPNTLSKSVSKVGYHNIKEVSEERIEHAIKSAKSAIMSRNMSHNLGSHVMFYLKNKLENVKTLIQEDVLRELIYVNADYKAISELVDKIKNNEITDTKLTELPFLIGLGKFINYLQERQDFLATVSTGDVPYFIPQSFKEAIFDELNSDYKAIRHDKTESYKAGCKNILLSYIAKSEGIERSDISIEYESFDGLNNENRSFNRDDIDSEGHIYSISNDHSNEIKIDKGEQAHNDLNKLRSIKVSFPGGIIGRQAVFSIVENFIRNSAKHSGKPADKLRIKIIIDEEFHDTLVKVVITNNLEDANDNLINKLSDAICEDYINDDGSLAENNKGIKEMRISAAWLRNYHGREKDANPPILKVFANEDTNAFNKSVKNLAYEFYLQKSWSVALISYNDAEEKIKKLFRRHNWDILTPKKYEDDNRDFRLVAIDSAIKGFNDSASRVLNYINIEELLTTLNEFSSEKDIAQFLFNQYTDWYEKIVLEKFSLTELPNVYIKDKPNMPQRRINDSRIKEEGEWVTHYEKENAIVFKDHLENEDQFDELFEMEHQNRFIESITGANSTSNLIRNEDLNKEWLCKIVESSLSDFLIIDERLWNYYSGIDEKDFNIKNTTNGFKMKSTNALLKLKNITICNIINEGEPGKFIMVDSFKQGLAKFSFKVVKKSLVVQFEILDEDILNKFNFISIHMSLYDKMRENLPLDYETITVLELFEKVCLDLLPDNTEPEEKIIVHTGKSKPANNDLVGKYKYLPFASIEHAIKDSKFSLSEVLNSAK